MSTGAVSAGGRRTGAAALRWAGLGAAGGVVPLLLLFLSTGVPIADSAALVTACVLALAGGAAWDYIWVEAGQSVPLS